MELIVGAQESSTPHELSIDYPSNFHPLAPNLLSMLKCLFGAR